MKAMNRSQIKKWLENHGIAQYTIHPNLVVDVKGDVNITGMQLKAFPFQFGEANGNFWCHSNKLETLQHCPTTVIGNFVCSYNNLTSLQYCPTTITGKFKCSDNPRFEVTTSNEGSWVRAIKTHKDVYEQIKDIATDRMTATYEMRWIP